MDVHAGHRAGATAELRCKDCPYVVMVARGDVIPPCPCGADVYEKNARMDPKRRSTPVLRKKVNQEIDEKLKSKKDRRAS